MAVFWQICVVVTLALCTQCFAQNKRMNLLGGWRDVDENDEKAQEALKFAREEYNEVSNDGYITKITRIIRLRRQVVAGMKYSMKVEALINPCSQNEFTTEECQNQKSRKQRCVFEVVTVPWKNHMDLTKGYCSNN
ncbi:cystatin-like [Anomaloglossus baeobatrachus]|uniref:cystatin-like n=1 Tax=Anomaloglossus baeobatrachus TaxID=238106 RepID=UPI003F4FAE61